MIIGAGGMLGISMSEALKDFNLITLNREELDITCYSKVRHALFKDQPDYVINCAAYTAVDKAEEEPELAFKINSSAVGMLAHVVKQVNATLIHFSTDYVFDGKATSPYKPEDPVNPINVYGASKWAGEQLIRASGVKHYIFRISWLYAPHGKNFYRWVLDNDLEEMQVVDTQVGCPTSAIDVADFIAHVIEKDPFNYGTYHFCNEGSMTWYDFATAIVKQAGLLKKIVAVSEFPAVAKRPEYSIMNNSNTSMAMFYDIPGINEALKNVQFNMKKH